MFVLEDEALGAAAGPSGKADALTPLAWSQLLAVLILARDMICRFVKTMAMPGPLKTSANGADRAALGYPAGGADVGIGERTRRLNFEQGLFDAFEAGKMRTHGYGQGAVAHVWPLIDEELRNSDQFKNLS